MKNIVKKYFGLLVIMLMTFSCETTELELTTDPNRQQPEDGEPRTLLNGMQISYLLFLEYSADVNAALTRIDPMVMDELGDGSYDAYFEFDERSTNGARRDLTDAWNRFYTFILPNARLLEENAAGDPLFDFNVALSNIIVAHCASVLVDQYGRIPFSQTGDFFEFPNPVLDAGEDVYQACFDLLDEAIAILGQSPRTDVADDFLYSGNADQAMSWLRFANSLKLRMYKNTGNVAAFNAIINSGLFITSTNEDAQFRYNTDFFAPEFQSDYLRNTSNSEPKSNWLMNQMLINDDPRIRYYFYRQVGQTPGVDTAANTMLECSDLEVPPHYDGFVYCSVGNGYVGRSHGNNTDEEFFDRVDAPLAVVEGVYPSGGVFDDNRFMPKDNVVGTSGGGAGIRPILLASDIDFWQGQLATDVGQKATLLRAGMTKSIAKVMSFGSLDTGADLSMGPDAVTVDNYINTVVDNFMAATGDDQENIFAVQFFISMYGNAMESYNYYRQTGYPTTLAPSWNPDPGAFPRSFRYPVNEQVNATVSNDNKQTTEQVFWDTNPPSPAFPIAN